MREVTIDMNDVNRYRNNVRSESGSRACFPLKRNPKGGCKNEAQCIRINEELDEEEHRLGELRRKYDLNDWGRNRFDAMYMIDPSIDGPKDETMGTTTMQTACSNRLPLQADYLINPNHLDNFRPDEEQWTYEPGSESIVRRKRDLAERQKLRIYPHMYNAGEVKRKEAADARQQREMMQQIPTEIRGGTDYPIPMYFELAPLQSMKTHSNVDYDIHLRKPCNTSTLPKWLDNTLPNQLSVQSNVDFERTTQTPTGAPPPRKKDYTCQQIRRQRAQEEAVIAQPKEWYQSTQNGYHKPPPRLIEPQTMSEKNVFGQNPNMKDLPGPKYPLEIDQPSGFFELGPALPPPNPLLLSNVPSRLLMYNQAINTTGDRDTDLQLRISTDPPAPTSERFESLQNTATGIKTSNNTTEFHVARSSEEAEMKQVVQASIFQQTTALKQISDLRHALAGLKQRIVEDRARNDAMSVAKGTFSLEEGTNAISSVREVIRAVQTRRAGALQKLKLSMTSTEYGNLETTVANQIKLMETQVKQYHQQPSPDMIECHTSPHFNGDGYIMGLGFYDYPNVGGIGYNKLKSLKIGNNVQVKLYQLANRKGNVATYIGPRRISLLPTLWDVAVNGIEILPKTGPMIDCYDAPFFQGGHVRLPVGFFDYPDVGGIQAGKLASIVIPDGLQVTFYSRPKGEGERVIFLGSQKMNFLPSDWNTKVFGITVATNGN